MPVSPLRKTIGSPLARPVATAPNFLGSFSMATLPTALFTKAASASP